MTVCKDGTFLNNLVSLKFTQYFHKHKSVMSFTYSIQCLSQFGSVHNESPGEVTNTTHQTNICLNTHFQTYTATFSLTHLPRHLTTRWLLLLSLFILGDVKFIWCMHLMMMSRMKFCWWIVTFTWSTQREDSGCIALGIKKWSYIEYLDKFREYYRMNTITFDYSLNTAKNDLISESVWKQKKTYFCS
jgi:hypothetical protein